MMSLIGVVTNFYQLTMTLKYTRSRRKQIFSILSVAKKEGGELRDYLAGPKRSIKKEGRKKKKNVRMQDRRKKEKNL